MLWGFTRASEGHSKHRDMFLVCSACQLLLVQPLCPPSDSVSPQPLYGVFPLQAHYEHTLPGGWVTVKSSYLFTTCLAMCKLVTWQGGKHEAVI